LEGGIAAETKDARAGDGAGGGARATKDENGETVENGTIYENENGRFEIFLYLAIKEYKNSKK
jgi:hypothetical protein